MSAKQQPDSQLDALRKEIDSVDEQIQALISKRARLAQEVGAAKGLTATADFYRPEREAQVLRRVIERNEGPLRDEELARVFRELMSACLAQEEPLKIGFLGPEGTFTQSAVLKHFGHSVRALPLATIEEVFHEVESGAADFGVVPIENSTEGTVNHTLDMFLTSPLKICGEVELPAFDGPNEGYRPDQARQLASAIARAMPCVARAVLAEHRAGPGVQ
jgi:chorismate mutase/prephenate dehydratase